VCGVAAGTHTARSDGTRWRACSVITSRWPRVANVSWCGVGTLMFFADLDGNVFGAMQYDTRAE
jgi:hypothetical protein